MRTVESLDDIQVLARTIWGEARGETIVGRVAVANVIINRLVAKRYGTTIKRVCLRPKQFSIWNKNNVNRAKALSVEIRDPIFAECMTIAKIAGMRALTDITIGSTHYHAAHIKPVWAGGKEPVAVLGHHVFYNDIDWGGT